MKTTSISGFANDLVLRRLGLLLAALIAFVMPLETSAQAISMSGTVTGETAVPIPGVGHDYLHLLSETVDPSTGSVNINLAFPIPKSRSITLPFSLAYSTAGVFRLENPGPAALALYPNCFEDNEPPVSFANICGGWNYTYPKQTLSYTSNQVNGADGADEGTKTTYTNYTFSDPTGVMHNLRLGYQCFLTPTPGSQCPSVDLSRHGDEQYTASFNSPANVDSLTDYTVFDNEGTTYHFVGNTSNLPQEIEDRNGNTIFPSLTHSSGSAYTLTMPDTAGRSSISVTGSESPGTTDEMNIGGLIYKATWTSTTVSYSMPAMSLFQSGNSLDTQCRSEGDFSIAANNTQSTISVVSSLILPDNQHQFTFYYGDNNPDTSVRNPYGLLSEIIYPNGGWVKYTYKPSDTFSLGGLFTGWTEAFGGGLQGSQVLPVANDCPYIYSVPVVATRMVSYDGSTVAQTQTFSYLTAFNGWQWTSKNTSVSTTDNVASKTYLKTYSYKPFSIGPPPYTNDSIATQIPVEYQVKTYDWGNTSAPLLTSTKTWRDQFSMTEQDTTIGGLTSKVIYQPGSYFPQETDEYDYGANTPTRKTLITYQPFSARGVMVEPCKVVVTDGGGAVFSETDSYYDGNTTLCADDSNGIDTGSVSGLPQNTHDETLYGPNSSAPRGDLTKQVHVLSGGQGPTTTYAYDETGQLTSETDPCGNTTCSDVAGSNHTTSYSYSDSPARTVNSNAYLTMVTRPNTGVSHITNYQYDYSSGNVIEVDDENQQPTNYSYSDPFLRLTDVYGPTSAQNGGARPHTHYKYTDGVGAYMLTTTPTGISSTEYYDGVGNATQTQMTSGPSGTESVDTTYDGMGRVQSVSNAYRTKGDATYGIASFSYDPLGRKVMQCNTDNSATPSVICQPASSFQKWMYSGNTVTFQDENGNQWQRIADAFGRLTTVMEPSGNASAPSMETDYTYDPLNNLTSVIQWGGSSNPAARSRQFSYDSLSRLVQALNPETGWTCYGTTGGVAPNGTNCTEGYDANGNIGSKTDARDVTTSYSYDVLNRILSRMFAGDASFSPVSCYQYDSASVANGKGRLANEWTQAPSSNSGTCSATAPSSGYITEHSIVGYDEVGRITSELEFTPASTAAGTSYSPAYSYHLDGSLNTSTSGVAPTGASSSIVLTNVFDGAGRLQNLTSNYTANSLYPTSLFAPASGSQSLPCGTTGSAQYWPSGTLMSAAMGNGLTINQSIDKRLRLGCEGALGNAPATSTAGSAAITITGAEQSQ